MKSHNIRFDARELCSRKLWQLVTEQSSHINAQQREQALNELCARRYSAARQHSAAKARHS